MSRQIWIIFLLITSVTVSFCQLSEDFGSQNLSEIWVGDRDNFTIDAARLRLQASEAGNSRLYAPIEWIDNISWNIDFQLDFNPSAQNQLRIYLFASDTLDMPASALFLEMGESGSNDALQLYHQAGDQIQLLASGSMATVATSPSIRLSGNVADEILTISIAEELLGRYDADIMMSVSGLNLLGSGFFGFNCTYSATRSDKFYFDNICVGEPKVDSLAPRVTDFRYVEGEFLIDWSEPILNTYDIIVTPQVSNLDDAHTASMIRINGSFEAGVEYQLELMNVEDNFGNSSDTVLNYIITRSPRPGELLINEILFNPTGSGSDYLEIINTTDEILSLENVKIRNADNGNEESIARSQISPGAIMLFTEDKLNTISDFHSHSEEVMVEQNLPAWNNDDGNATLILEDEIIDAMDYNEDQHLTVIDDVNGVSLERISLSASSGDADNWGSAAGSVGYGTPGLANSISDLSAATEFNFDILNKVISPNDDGLSDELIINYNLNEPNYVTTVRIYSDSGSLRDYLLRNETLATQGQMIWDGRDDAGQLVEQGIYILHISMFNLEGRSYQKNLSFAVAYPDR